MLGQREVGIDRVDRLERDDGLTVPQNLAQLHEPDPEPSGKWSPNALLGDHRPKIIRGGSGLLRLRFGRVEIGAGVGALLAQFASAAKIDFRQVSDGLGRAQLGIFRAHIQLYEQITYRDIGTRLKIDRDHFSGHLGADHHALHRSHGAVGSQDILPRFFGRGLGRDRFGRRIKGCARRTHRSELQFLGAAERDDHNEQTEDGRDVDENFLNHGR